jgi:undecaprenyl-diphosphatase
MKGCMKMNNTTKKTLCRGVTYIVAFIVWTIMIVTVDVQPVGVNGTNVGLAYINTWVHMHTEVNMSLYTITDWLGLVPVLVCVLFGIMGLTQLLRRKSLRKVDVDILVLGLYYIVVIICYIIFEEFPINYRPILIDGVMEASYPSSTTLLVLSVMPTLVFLVERRLNSKCCIKLIYVITMLFSMFMVIGRLVSGVHWLTDIIGSILLSVGLFYTYKSVCMLCEKRRLNDGV